MCFFFCETILHTLSDSQRKGLHFNEQSKMLYSGSLSRVQCELNVILLLSPKADSSYSIF